MAGLLLKANFGIFEDLDFGIHYESLSIGVRAKYAWINSQEQGWSVSTAAGVGRGGYSTHYYGDLMAGHLKRPWEPYGTLRIVHVKTDPVELEDESNGDHFFHFETIDSVSFTYGQLILGARYWTQPQYFLSGEISTLAAFDSDVTIGNGFILSGALGRRF